MAVLDKLARDGAHFCGTPTLGKVGEISLSYIEYLHGYFNSVCQCTNGCDFLIYFRHQTSKRMQANNSCELSRFP